MRRPLRSDAARALADLAIELGDPGRMARARKLHRSGAVGEITVTPGRLATTIFGSDGERSQAVIEIALPLPSSVQVPDPSSVWNTSCSCEDSAPRCPHVLATLLRMAERVESDPASLTSWTTEHPSGSATGLRTNGPDPFLDGKWRSDLAPVRFPACADPDVAPLLIADGVDAWPVLADARSALSARLAELRQPPPESDG